MIRSFIFKNGKLVSRDVGPVIRTAPGLLNSEAEVDRFMNILGKKLRA